MKLSQKHLDTVSIVIPNYNQGHLICDAIRSAIDQDYPKDKYDIIIVDDGSTDDSVKIITDYIQKRQTYEVEDNDYSDPPIKLIAKTNGGTASARNAGIKESVNDIIAFLDSDDLYLKDKLKRSVEELNRYPNTGCVYSDYIEEQINGDKNYTFKRSFDLSILLEQCIVSTNSVMFKHVFDLIGEIDESIKGCEDYDLWLRISLAGFMIRHIPEVLFIYRHHGMNKTETSDMKEWFEEESKVRNRALSGTYYVSNV